jgi:stress-induced morphogen
MFTRQAILVKELSPSSVSVVDASGGCGSMYNISVESTVFKVIFSVL